MHLSKKARTSLKVWQNAFDTIPHHILIKGMEVKIFGYARLDEGMESVDKQVTGLWLELKEIECSTDSSYNPFGVVGFKVRLLNKKWVAPEDGHPAARIVNETIQRISHDWWHECRQRHGAKIQSINDWNPDKICPICNGVGGRNEKYISV